MSDNWRGSIGVSEVNTKELSWNHGLNESKWMNTVCLHTTLSVIQIAVLTISPHCPCTFLEGELSVSFSETIDSCCWHLQVELKISITNDEIRVFHVKESILLGSSGSHLKLEWISVDHETLRFESVIVCCCFSIYDISWWVINLRLILIAEPNSSGCETNLTYVESDILGDVIVLSVRNELWVDSEVQSSFNAEVLI